MLSDQSLVDRLTTDALATAAAHDGSVSRGGFVLLELANLLCDRLPERKEAQRGRLALFAADCIGAGC